MAVKPLADIKTAINALTPLVTLPEIQSILIDMADSSMDITNRLVMQTHTLDRDLDAGTTTVEHALSTLVLIVLIPDGEEIHMATFRNTSEDAFDLDWTGDSLTTPTLYILTV